MPAIWISYFPQGSDGKLRTDVSVFSHIQLAEIKAVESLAEPDNPVKTRFVVWLGSEGKPTVYHLPHTVAELTRDCEGVRAEICHHLNALNEGRTPPALAYEAEPQPTPPRRIAAAVPALKRGKFWRPIFR